MKFEIEKDSAQSILDYLQTRPYGEVFRLIPLIVGLTPISEPENASEPPEKDDG